MLIILDREIEDVMGLAHKTPGQGPGIVLRANRLELRSPTRVQYLVGICVEFLECALEVRTRVDVPLFLESLLNLPGQRLHPMPALHPIFLGSVFDNV